MDIQAHLRAQINKQMGVHWGISDNAKCPCFNSPVESSAHHIFCPQKYRVTLWRHYMHDLVSCLKSVKTSPHLAGSITIYLLSRGTHNFFSSTNNPVIQSLAQQVDTIGFLNMSWGVSPPPRQPIRIYYIVRVDRDDKGRHGNNIL